MNQVGFKLALLLATTYASASMAQAPAYYYHGRHKVEVEVVTDTLAVKDEQSTGALRARVGAALPAAKVKSARGLTDRTVVETSARDLKELNAQAAQIMKAVPGARVQAILRRREGGVEAPAKALTAEISFKPAVGKSASDLQATYKLQSVRVVDFAPDIYIGQVDVSADLLNALTTANAMQESGDAEWATPMVEEQKEKRALPNDPWFPNQWHLLNLGINTQVGVAGNDLNVVPAWLLATGAGVNIAIADDGLQVNHPDLAPNAKTAIDFDFNQNDQDPSPANFHSHGTGCAGVAAGKGNNGIGITGVAPEAGIVGLKILAGAITDEQQAVALSWRKSDPDPATNVSVHSNSWGPSDDGRTLEGLAPLSEAALELSVNEGRNGKGVVYTWAAGNGRTSLDNINKDGYANSPYVIAVGASNSTGTYSYYSEPGAAMLVNAPSNDVPDGIFTTDLTGQAGSNSTDYRGDFGGTSSATPAAAGVIALMLQANPNLTYRDVMHILMRTAFPNNLVSGGWKTNGAGFQFSHSYGFGRVDAGAAVLAATTWLNVPAPAPIVTVEDDLVAPLPIPDQNLTGLEQTIDVSAAGDFVVEHVELEADITHTFRGDLTLLLESPSGMVSELIVATGNDPNDNYSNWRFRSVAHWGENPSGTWRLRVADEYLADTGQLNGFTLRIRGYRGSQASADLWHLY